LPDWEEARKSLEELDLDEKAIAAVSEQEGDSRDLVETCMALEEALPSVQVFPSVAKVDLAGQAK